MGEGFRYEVWDFFYKIISPFIMFKESIQKIIEWFPIIWRDRDWDQNYIYKLLEHKFDSMSKYQYKYGNSVNSEKYSEELVTARNLCHKLLNYDYEQKLYEADKNKLFQYISDHIESWWD